MRRILVSGFAAIATFSVLANNFVPVSAPASAGVDLPAGFAPQGMARLSEQPVYSPTTPVPGETAVTPVMLQPDLTAFEPHSTKTESPDIKTVQAAPVIESKPFVAAWSQKPAASFERRKLESAPAPISTEILTVKTSDHLAMNQALETKATRSAVMPDQAAAPIKKQADYVAASRVAPIDFFVPRSLIEQPVAVSDTGILAVLNEHQIAGAYTESISGRTTFNADLSSFQPRVPEFITAAYQAPETIFQRARFVTEPSGPAAIEILSGRGEHTARNHVGAADVARTSASAEKAWLPSLVASVTEIATSVFGRERIAAPEETVPSTDILASTETHALNGSLPEPIERRSENRKAELAPYLPSFISTLAVAPSAAFQRMGLLPMPESTVSTESLLSANGDHTIGPNGTITAVKDRGTVTQDVAGAPVKNSPVLISADTAMNSSMLKPMSAGPLVSAPLPNENAVASTGYNATPFDRMIATPDVPEAVLKAQPTLISSKTEFSNDLLKPMNAVASNPFVGLTKEEIIAAAQQRDNYCDPNFVGPPIRFSQTVELKLDDLLRQLHQRFGVNFIVGPSVADKPMNIKAGSIPWNVLLKSQLFISGVRARCIDANTIELVENAALPSLQDQADVETRFLKLKFLQRTGGGTVDLANRSQGGQSGNQGGGCGGNNQGGTSGSVSSGGGQGGGGQQGQTVGQQSSNKFDKLIVEIEKILGLRSMQESSVGGDSGGGGSTQSQREAARSNRFVTQIPGRNILAIRATKEEHDLIDQIVSRADRPPFQVVIKGLVYTANQDKLRDIGVSTTITGGTADGRTTGGLFGDTLGVGTLFDFSTVIGTFDFNVQATAFQQNGVISVKSRPFATVIDGLCTTLDVGRQLPIVIDSSLGGQGDVVFVNAANNLAVTPYVIDDENGNPVAVTLELRLTANDIDSSVTARGVPAISARSIQTQLLLNEDKTAILGGFTVDSDSRTVQKTPGLGDIPLIGELFKRRIRDTRVNRLYFAVSVDILPYPEPIRPVDVPGATTDPPSITPEQKKRADAAEPKQVKGP